MRDERARVDHEHESGDGEHEQVEEEVPSFRSGGGFRVRHGRKNVFPFFFSCRARGSWTVGVGTVSECRRLEVSEVESGWMITCDRSYP